MQMITLEHSEYTNNDHIQSESASDDHIKHFKYENDDYINKTF